MIIGVLKEPITENRVSALPEMADQIVKMNFDVMVERGAALRAFASDEDYEAVGCKIQSREDTLSFSDLIVCINPPLRADVERMKSGAVLLSLFYPLNNKEFVFELLELGITSFSLDMVPRTTRAQTMDVLSSQATVAGYKAVLLGAAQLPKFFPMLMTAAGSVAPAKVLVLGAGVAGLQAIATARRLGAVVEAFDTRTAVKEEVKSLGAKFIEVEGSVESTAAGGYAVEQTKEFLEKQNEKIYQSAAKADLIITTAQIPGRKAPLLIPKSTVDAMKAGSVIIDLAASTGGNCELCRNDETVVSTNGVTIVGNSNLPSTMPSDASKMFGKNVLNFLKLILQDGQISLNFEDEIVKGTCITYNKELINNRVKEKWIQQPA